MVPEMVHAPGDATESTAEATWRSMALSNYRV